MSRRVVVTLAAGRAGKELLAVSGPVMQAYARRVGADFKAVTNPAVSPGYPLGAKFAAGRAFAAGYDRLLFLDADLILSPDCPDLFAAVPATHAGLYDDTPDLTATAWLDAEYHALCDSQGWGRTRPPYCLNTGVVVASAAHAALFVPPARPYPVTHCSEQNLINLNAHRHGVPVHRLPAALNWQWWARRGEFDAPGQHVYHFAGMSQAGQMPDAPGPAGRLAAMRAMAERLYPDRGGCAHRSPHPVESQACCGQRSDPANDVYGCDRHERCSTGFALHELAVTRCRVCPGHEMADG